MHEYFKIGKIVAAHGVKGEMLLKHELGKKSNLDNLQAIFIEEKKDSFIPWFIETANAKSDTETILKVEAIDSREAAAKFIQKEIWLTEENFKKLAAKSSPINLLGYTIIENKKMLGKVLEVMEQPHQLLCMIEIETKEVLIPLNEETLKKIDHKKREVRVELPEGLLDIYL